MRGMYGDWKFLRVVHRRPAHSRWRDAGRCAVDQWLHPHDCRAVEHTRALSLVARGFLGRLGSLTTGSRTRFSGKLWNGRSSTRCCKVGCGQRCALDGDLADATFR